MMRYTVLAAAVISLASVVARADSIEYGYTANGRASLLSSGLYGVTSTPFARFDPALGTLVAVTINLSGTANVSNFVTLEGISVRNAENSFFLDGTDVTGQGSGSFQFSAYGTRTYSGSDLSDFEGPGTQALVPEFLFGAVESGSVRTHDTTGSITYNYIPPTVMTPEPSSLALLGTGVLCLIRTARKRFA